jgi:hypothetical protein
VRLTAAPDRAAGLAAIAGADGSEAMLTVDHDGGARCWRIIPYRYLYFALDEKQRPWPGGATELEIEYVDRGDANIRIEYDSTDPAAAFNGAYKVHPVVIHLANTGRTQTARFALSDARFTGSQNLHADFRISHTGDDALIRAVRLRRGEE